MYIIIWSFRVSEIHRAKFEEAYGPKGVWAQLFRKSRGYISTELLKSDDNQYCTIDRWRSREDYHQFKQLSGEEYRLIDQRCEELTASEEPVGEFWLIE